MKRLSLSTALLALALATGPLAAQEATPGAHFVENWDLDGDGAVTLAEAVEKRGQVFYMFDQDENGVLDAAEYDLFDETREADRAANADGHTNRAMDVAEGGMARAANDPDGDGQVTAAEFEQTAADWFARMDRTGDGVVTTADFGPGAMGGQGMGQGHGMGQGNGMGMGQGKGMGQPKG